MYEIYVYAPSDGLDKNEAMVYCPVGVVDVWESLQWLTYYKESGEALLICPYTEQNAQILKVGNLLRYDDVQGMLIEQVELQDRENKATLTVRAQTYDSTLAQRIGLNTTLLHTVEELVEFLEKNHRGSGLRMPIALEGDFSDREYFLESSWENLQEVLQQVCAQIGMGFRSVLVQREQNLVNQLCLYSGMDLSVAKNYKGYLGAADDIENLYILDSNKEYKNVAYVLGKEKDEVTPMVVVTLGEVEPDKRRETVVKATDLSRTYIANEKTGKLDLQAQPIYEDIEKEYSEEEYLEILRTRGRSELMQRLPKLTISAEIVQMNATMQYGVDYSLGDIVLVQIPEYRLAAKARVAGTKVVAEVESGEYRTIILEDFEVVE